MADTLKILFVASECVPFAKTGGLADVTGSLPKALVALGHDVRVVMPFYRGTGAAGFGKTVLKTGLSLSKRVPATALERDFDLRQDFLPGTRIPVYLIEQRHYFDREGLYGDQFGDFGDNLDRFAFLSHAALASALDQGFHPDVVHCHDWHSGMLPVFLRTHYGEEPAFKKTGTLFTIHNLAYQGVFGDSQFPHLGLPPDLFTHERLEFYGQVNFMKAALLYADRISTVSPRYAEEIQTLEYGCGLEGVLKSRNGHLSGILNGLDTTEWSPETDPFIATHYSKDSLELKAKVKEEFIRAHKLDWDVEAPLIGVVSRLDNMKGLNLLEEIMDYLMHLDLNFVLLGTGEPRYMDSFKRIGETYPDKASIHLTFSNEMAHKIEAASDILLMPSRFEPCGTNQLISLRYGTAPVVRSTGGLAYTVKEFDARTLSGNGFTFHEFSSMGLFNAIKRALDIYKDKKQWRALQLNGMNADHSWGASAKQYEGLYRKIKEQAA